MYRYFRNILRSVRRHPRCLSTEACVEKNILTEHPVFPAQQHARTTPRHFGSAEVRWSRYLATEFPAISVFTCDNATVRGPDGWVTLPNGKLIPDLGWFRHHTFEIDKKKMRMDRIEHIHGRVLSIATNFADINYGHYVLDSLPRFGLFLKAGFTPSDFDFLYTPKPLGRGARNLLARLGVPENKILIAEPRVAIAPDQLIATSFPGIRMNYLPWTIDFIRSLRPDLAASTGQRRLFIDRKSDLRHLANNDQLKAVLQQFNFECINPAEVDDAPKLFSEAAIVVGAHSAGLTDIAFCRPGTHVLELIPSDHQQPYYYTEADSAGHRYSYIVGQSQGRRPLGATGPSKLDFIIDPATLQQAIETMLAEIP